ncbi:MAG: hypothetical protein IJR83_05740 [Clostridia bacterium]|nr:hypothetical protein [Clostridia bacterium]
MKKRIALLTAFALAVLLLLCSLSGCVSSTSTLMSLGKSTISVNTYELLLSRLKGNLAYSVRTQTGYSVTDESFWNMTISMDGTTYNQYFSQAVLNNLKQYLVTLYLFDEEYGLTLPDSYYKSIDEDMQERIDYDANGSKSTFNRILADYGVNYDMLRDIYIMEAKLEYLKQHLYGARASLVATSAKDEFYQSNFVCFKQIFLANYKYIPERDGDGNVIYYNQDGTIAYDTVNGVPDSEGVYRNPDGTVAYDEENGLINYLDRDNDGESDTESLSAEELRAVESRVSELMAALDEHPGDPITFEHYIYTDSDDAGTDSGYEDGYFLCKDISYSSLGQDMDYLNTARDSLLTMEVGDVILLTSDYGYHIIRKYELPDGAYSKENNQIWFENDLFSFSDLICDELFYDKCQPYMDRIVIYDNVMAVAPDMKSVGVNFYY